MSIQVGDMYDAKGMEAKVIAVENGVVTMKRRNIPNGRQWKEFTLPERLLDTPGKTGWRKRRAEAGK